MNNRYERFFPGLKNEGPSTRKLAPVIRVFRLSHSHYFEKLYLINILRQNVRQTNNSVAKNKNQFL